MGVGCSNCGEAKPIKAKEMCSTCYRYWLRTGTMRPKPTSPHRYATICINCGGDLIKGRKRNGMCHACYNFLRANGRMRTPADGRHTQGGTCTNCKAGIAVAKGLCKACYNYQKYNGVPRPRRLYSRPEKCKNCGYPLVSGARSGLSRRQKGLCRRCYEYRQVFKTNRPAHLWGKGEHGWCDCSQPATHAVSVRIKNYTETIPLCDACYAEYQRQVRWYGDSSQRKDKGANHP